MSWSVRRDISDSDGELLGLTGFGTRADGRPEAGLFHVFAPSRVRQWYPTLTPKGHEGKRSFLKRTLYWRCRAQLLQRTLGHLPRDAVPPDDEGDAAARPQAGEYPRVDTGEQGQASQLRCIQYENPPSRRYSSNRSRWGPKKEARGSVRVYPSAIVVSPNRRVRAERTADDLTREK